MGSKIMGRWFENSTILSTPGLFIALVAIEVYYKFDGTLGFLLVLFATWSLLAAIFLGEYLKEAVEVILDFSLADSIGKQHPRIGENKEADGYC